jgi:hypothetical protein
MFRKEEERMASRESDDPPGLVFFAMASIALVATVASRGYGWGSLWWVAFMFAPMFLWRIVSAARKGTFRMDMVTRYFIGTMMGGFLWFMLEGGDEPRGTTREDRILQVIVLVFVGGGSYEVAYQMGRNDERELQSRRQGNPTTSSEYRRGPDEFNLPL